MNNLNSVLIEGNLVKDPVIRSTPKGTQVCTLIVASCRYYKEDAGFEKEVCYFEVETWGKLAEACYSKGKKGRGVRTVGRLRQDRWNDLDGKFRSKITIVADHVEFRPEFKKATLEKGFVEEVENLDDEEFFEQVDQPVEDLVDEPLVQAVA